ncbi:uncharacterized protein I206_105094 [Kwoniella pini CBS 10737]|uniref:RlpA-like protein double-psi beta-barrel domain-containing protein n=1 Tax=Kwoniella pini CBS 10737 TaxID=1296096 RepID=A0A1B9I8L4_9TREE|nr:uncharacterized protein I206_02634 [Kwoniella pini CBS 10737]OCF51918.1 hypothetical protein I206_02634 [Kwoniella pini CBS 10737]
MFAKIFTALLVASAVVAAPLESQPEKRITHTGQATYFEVGLGACGWWNVDDDYIVALNSDQYQRNGGSNCGQGIRLTNSDTGKSITVTVADECPTCADGSLDLSPAAFSELSGGNMGEGVFPISWHFNRKD